MKPRIRFEPMLKCWTCTGRTGPREVTICSGATPAEAFAKFSSGDEHLVSIEVRSAALVEALSRMQR